MATSERRHMEPQKTTLSQDIDIISDKEKYDASCKRILAEVAVLPDETNAPKITGTGVEDASVTAGTVTYVIQIRARIPDTGEIAEMIVNVEAQDVLDNELLKLLDVLLSSDRKAHEKKKILEKEFGIPMTEEICACIGCDEEYINKIEESIR